MPRRSRTPEHVPLPGRGKTTGVRGGRAGILTNWGNLCISSRREPMRRTLRVGVVALGLLAAAAADAPAAPKKKASPAVDQKKIDQAIDRGAAALRRMQRADGTWEVRESGGTSLA